MRNLLLSVTVSLVLSLLGTPLVIRYCVAKGYGQFIRDDGPRSHHTKRGTPTMGGIVIIGSAVVGWFCSHLTGNIGLTASGLLVVFLMVGLGIVGFIDDLLKIRRERNLGLNKRAKFGGQLLVAIIFAVLVLQFSNGLHMTPASEYLSWVKDTGVYLGPIGFVVWAVFIVAASSNGVNLTDGLDGLATGALILTFIAYTGIAFWQYRNPDLYIVRDPLDLSLLAGALFGSCLGFLWWNASPARIFMGDSGALGLGGAIAGFAVCTRTEVLLVLLGGLFVIETMSDVLQIGSFHLRHKRIFKMAPLHHHFELLGWKEITVTIRFWIIQGLCVALAAGIFFGDYITRAK